MTQMHQVREDEWNAHCDTMGAVMVRLADVRPGQQTMRVTMEEIHAMLHHEQMRTAYFATREKPDE